MKCVFCGDDSATVVDGVYSGRTYYRRKRCKSCSALYFTKEQAVTADNAEMRAAFREKSARNKANNWDKWYSEHRDEQLVKMKIRNAKRKG